MMEHDHEPVPGLPAPLPEGETILWQGSPETWAMARRAYHVGQIGVYFAALAAWSLYGAHAAGGPWGEALTTALRLAALAAGAAGILCLLAWLTARTTIYTITSRRVVLRFGIALPISLNLPFAQIDGAGLRVWRDGTGDIPLTLRKGQRAAYLVLWPHVRPWRLTRSEPMLRGIPDPASVAQILGRALATANAQPAPVLDSRSVADGASARPAAAAV